jgi:hypothetical protein
VVLERLPGHQDVARVVLHQEDLHHLVTAHARTCPLDSATTGPVVATRRRPWSGRLIRA